jgi:ribosomal protein S27AE
MESPQVQPAPCPKCGGVRFLADGSEFGLKLSFALSALYCTSCGYVEFYAGKVKLESLAQERADAAAKAAKQQEI